MIIALVGFMGTGKSTVGKCLAEELGYSFIDTDSLIEEKSGKEIGDIFAEKGEQYFRQLETVVLREILEDYDNIVLATGGGIVIAEENRKLLMEKSMAILLTASVDEIYKRTSDTDRPLLNSANPIEKIKVLLKNRELYYNQFNYYVNTDGKDVSGIAEEIMRLI